PPHPTFPMPVASSNIPFPLFPRREPASAFRPPPAPQSGYERDRFLHDPRHPGGEGGVDDVARSLRPESRVRAPCLREWRASRGPDLRGQVDDRVVALHEPRQCLDAHRSAWTGSTPRPRSIAAPSAVRAMAVTAW